MKKSKRAIRKYKQETRRWQFWAWMMEKHPRLYGWCDKHLPIDTLPF